MATVLGVDEAGRGAVLGPLIVAGICVEEKELQDLWGLGARDSKQVAREERIALVRAIARSGARGRVVVIPASAVDRENLTSLERDAVLALVTALSPARVVVDTPVGPRAIPQFSDSLSFQSGLPRVAITVVPKADQDHPAVAAASLLAKVVRDGYVVGLRRQYGDFGWGYPSEPKVRALLSAWLAEHGTFPSICRTRWRCVQDLLSPRLLE
jgi:ribonuclease HII